MLKSLTTALTLTFGAGLAASANEILPYPGAPDIAPPMTHVEKYAPVLDGSLGPAIDPAKGYRVEDFGNGAFMVTEGIYQAMFVRTADGLILADAPPNIGARLLAAADEIAPGAPITHLIYSHAHIDHIGFAAEIVKSNPDMAIVAHEETAEILARAGDPNRPAPTVVFGGTNETHALSAGGQALNLTYPGGNHQDGNIEIWHPESRTLMVIDVVFPGWMMWRNLAIAEDVPGLFDVVGSLNDRYDFEKLVAGHVGRAGTREDVTAGLEFLTDLHAAAGQALASVTPGEGVDPADYGNPWGLFDNYLDRVIIACVNAMAPKWQDRLSAFEVFIYEQCSTMEQSIRVDGPSL